MQSTINGKWAAHSTGPLQRKLFIPSDPARESSQRVMQHFPLNVLQGHGWNDRDTADNATQIEIRFPILVDELEGVFGLARPGLQGVGVKQITDIGPRNDGHDHPAISPHQRIAQVEIREFVVDVTVKEIRDDSVLVVVDGQSRELKMVVK